MHSKTHKKPTGIVLLAAAVLLLCFSCAGEKTMEEKLKSQDKSEIKSALTDIWRLNQSEYLPVIINFLNDPDLREDAALTLSLAGLDALDEAIYGAMTAAKDKTGHLYYFLLRSRAAGFDRESMLKRIKNIHPAGEKANPDESFVYCALTGDYAGALKLFDRAPAVKNAKKEFIMLLGEKKYAPAYGFLESISTRDIYLRPFSVWAKNTIKPVRKIKADFRDRVIKSSPYWKKYGTGPVIPVVPGTYKSVHTANPDILVNNDIIYYYYRGGDGTDRICASSVAYDRFNGRNFIDFPYNPIIDIGKDDFENYGVLDPSAIYFDKKVFLYYSGLGKGTNAVGLATSKDFYNFSKYPKNPVIIGRAPSVVEKDGVIYMIYVLPNERGGFSIFLATSRDGYNFKKYSDTPVLDYERDESTWDSKSVTTPRIYEKDGVYYMMYAGDNMYHDYPPFFGIAFSYDMVHWIKGTQNPVFSRSEKGDWDDGGIWFAQVFEYNCKWYLWYEGWGGGESHEKEYGPGGHSQIGMATGEYDLAEML
jgi:predicted GH43/DUF377 family glycosyl hydrolase